jgi:hypothetical protein
MFGGGYGGGLGSVLTILTFALPNLAAGVHGLSLVYPLVLVLPAVIFIQGMCQIYLSAIEGLDLKGAASTPRRISQVKGKFEKAQAPPRPPPGRPAERPA